MKILVTGAGGFIAGHLVKYLFNKGFNDIRAVDIKPLDQWFQKHEAAENISLDLQEKSSCALAVKDADIIYNLACDMGGMGFIEYNKALCMLSVLINTNLIRAAKDEGCKRFFFASSACVYNASKQNISDVTALKEDDVYPALPEDGYGWEKLFSERMCRHFNEDFGLITRVARYHNIYGPCGTYDGGREKAPAAICRKVANAVITGNQEIEVWGDGSQTRSFMYIEDCLEGTMKIMNSEVLKGPLNLGSSELVSINMLVDMVAEIAGTRISKRYNLSAPKGVQGRNSDNSKIKECLNWIPSISLQTGLEKTYEWVYNEMLQQSYSRSKIYVT